MARRGRRPRWRPGRATAQKRPRAWRWLRRAALAGGALALLVVVALAAAVLWLNSTAGLRFVVDRGLSAAGEVMNGRIVVGDAEGHLLSSFTLRDVALRDADDVALVAADAIEITWTPVALIDRRVVVESVSIRGADGRLAMGPDGLNVAALFPSSEKDEPAGELPVTIEIGRAELDGAVSFDPDGDGERPAYALDELTLAGRYSLRGARHEIGVERLAATATEPALGPLAIAGEAVIDALAMPEVDLTVEVAGARLAAAGAVGPLAAPQFDVQLDLDALAFEALEPLTGGPLPLTGAVDADLAVRGTLDALTAAGTITPPRGRIGVDAAVDLEAAPLAYRATLDLDDLDLSSFIALPPAAPGEPAPAPLTSSLSGRVLVDAHGTGTDTLEGRVELTLDDSALLDHHVDALALEATVAPELEVVVERLHAEAPLATADLTGGASVSSRTFRAAGTLRRVDLAAIGSLAAVDGLGGQAGVELDARGGWGGPAGVWVDGHGQVHVVALRAPSTEARQLTASFRGGYGGGGPRVELSGDLQELTAGPLPMDHARFRLALDAAGIEGELEARSGQRLAVATGLRVDWGGADPRIDVAWLTLDTYGSHFTAARPFAVVFRPGGVIGLSGIALGGSAGRLFADGNLAPSGYSQLTARGEALTLAALQPLLPADAPPLVGLAAFELAFEGPAAMPSANLQLTCDGFSYGDYGPFALQAGVVVAGGMTTVVASAGAKQIEPLRLQGLVPFTVALQGAGWDPDGILQLFAEMPAQPLDALAKVIPPLASAPPMRAGVSLSAGGTGRQPVLVLRGSVRELLLGELPPMSANIQGGLDRGRFDVEARLRDPRAELLGLVLGGEFALGRLLVERLGGERGASQAPYLGAVVTDLDVIGLPVESLRPFVPAIEPVHGKLVGRVRLEGNAASPQLTADLALRGGRLGEVHLRRTQLTAAVVGGEAAVQLEIEPRDGGTLVAQATSPLDIRLVGGLDAAQRFGQPPLDGTLDAEGLPLGMATAFVKGATDTEGTITANGSVTGTLLDPDPDLRLAVDEGAVCLDSLGVCFGEIDIDARSSLRKLVLQKLRLTSQPAQDVRNRKRNRARKGNGGRGARRAVDDAGWLEGTGSVVLGGEDRGLTDLKLDAERFWFAYNRQIKLRSDLAVTAAGVYPALRVRGAVHVGLLKVELGDELRHSAWPLDRDPALRIHRAGEQPAEAQEEEVARLALADEIDLRLQVFLEQNSWLYADMSAIPLLGRVRPNLQLGGDVELTMREGRPTVQGEVRTVRGTLTVLGRQFRVQEGDVVFIGSSPPDPELNVTAAYNSRYGTIRVIVDGRASKPQIRFESDEYEDEADILAILMFGTPMDEMRSGQSASVAGDTATELAILAGMGLGNQAIAKLFGHNALDLINLETNPAGPGSYGIEVGKALTDRIFVITRYRWGSLQQDENVFEAQLEFQLSRSLFFEIRYGDAGNGGIELLFKRRVWPPRPRAQGTK